MMQGFVSKRAIIIDNNLNTIKLILNAKTIVSKRLTLKNTVVGNALHFINITTIL